MQSPPVRLTASAVAEALRELGGNQAAVARKFAVTRSALAQYIRRHPSLRAVLEEARSTFVDNVESALY